MAIPPKTNPSAHGRGTLKSLAMLALGAVSAVYLANPTWGLFEFLPDNLPGLGNVDEALAALLLFRALAYFGINLMGPSRGQGKPDGPIIDIGGPGDRKK